MGRLEVADYTGAAVPLLETTIGAHFEAVAGRSPDHPAVIVPHQGIRWSYGELQAAVDRFAAGLIALGVQRGDRVGIWSPNRIEWVLTQFATAKIGAIMVCINPAYRPYELEYALNKAGCRALVTARRFKSSDYLDMLRRLAPELDSCEPGRLRARRVPSLRSVISMGPEPQPGMFPFDAVMDLGQDSAPGRLAELGRSLDPDDSINIQFTSGTTGAPKGATLTHRNILNNAYLSGLSMRFSPDDRLCIPVPLYHCFGMVLGTLLCVAHGATMVLPSESFDPAATLEAVAAERCTALHGVPTMFLAELDLPDLKRRDLGALRTGIIAGSTCPVGLMNRLIQEMGLAEIVIGYGQTECSPINAMTAVEDSFERRVSTVGRAHFNWRQKIVRPDGTTAAIGEQGEICSRGYGVMRGYWDDEARTRETVDADGFLHSGDLGEMDAEGYVKVTGRIKDMIIRGGENIYPREIEEFLYTHPEIAEAQVFGVPDPRYGEQVCAWVQLRPGSRLGPEEVRAFCAGRIAHFKVPRHVRIVDDFPMTVTGKMQKFAMRERMAEDLALAGPPAADGEAVT